MTAGDESYLRVQTGSRELTKNFPSGGVAARLGA